MVEGLVYMKGITSGSFQTPSQSHLLQLDTVGSLELLPSGDLTWANKMVYSYCLQQEWRWLCISHTVLLDLVTSDVSHFYFIQKSKPYYCVTVDINNTFRERPALY